MRKGMKMFHLDSSSMQRLQPIAEQCPTSRRRWRDLRALFLILTFYAVVSVLAYAKDTTQYGAGLIVNVPFPEAEVRAAVQEVIQNGIIRGSKEYDREEYITGAELATSAKGFPAWQEGGNVFYKVRTHALDPRNFKESGDVGTLAVRYVVQAQGDKNTVLRIDAIFVEDFRRTVHPSNGSVEGAEYKEIHNHLEALQLIRKEAAEVQSEHRAQVNEKLLRSENLPSVLKSPAAKSAEATRPEVEAQPPEPKQEQETPEQQLQSLHRQVQRIVKPPGAALKASPFLSAKTLVTLPSGTEVLIVILTPYWYGVETHAGQHGWVSRDELELLP
jgi:hypothetical protein